MSKGDLPSIDPQTYRSRMRETETDKDKDKETELLVSQAMIS